MALDVHEVNGVSVVALEGDIDLQSAPAVRQHLLACVAAGALPPPSMHTCAPRRGRAV